MNDYRQTVASFVPAIIRARALASSDELLTAGSKDHGAGVLFADISGFTRLTELLSERGPDGAEQLTRLLNRYFGSIVDVVEGAGGDVLKFAGDALLAVWPVPAVDSDLSDAVVTITEVSRILQQRLHDFEVAPGIRLSMKLAVGAGIVTVEHLGGVFDRWEFVVAGRPLAQLGRANDVAQAGQIVLADEAASLLPCGYQLQQVEPGVQRLLGADHTLREQNRARAAALPDEAQTEQLLTFLPAAIRQRVAAGYADWLCELRQVTIVFMNLPGFGVDTSLVAAQEAMRALQTALYRFEGSINKVSVDDKGTSLIAVLGLPPLSHVDDAERAVRAALEMRDGLAALHLSCAIGICSGMAFCGVVGNDRRREYTVMGDVVNLSARLMQASAGGILCDANTREQVGARMHFDALAELHVKGKAQAVAVFVPSHRDVTGATSQLPRSLHGREAERRRLAKILELVLAPTGVPVPRVCVSADGGLGKWTLVVETLECAIEANAQVLIAAGDPLDTLTPLRAWRTPLMALLGATPGSSSADIDPDALLARMPGQHARHYAPLLNDVFPLALADNDFTRALTGEARREQLLVLLTELVVGHAQLAPTVLALRDAHLLDASSWDLIVRIDAAAPQLLLIATLRPTSQSLGVVAHGWLSADTTQCIELHALAPELLLELARTRLNARALDSQLQQLIIERTNGSPLYCEELLAAMCAAGGVVVEAGVARLRRSEGLDGADFPASLQGLISSRIDRLEARAQMTLKVASVVGRLFAVAFVAAVHPMTSASHDFSDDIRCLLDAELITRLPFGVRADFGMPPYYQFKNDLVRDVVYGLMLYSQRRALHLRVAQWIEARPADELAPHLATLGRHWGLAGGGSEPDADALTRATSSLDRAADRANAGFANHEAVGLYREALSFVRMLEPSSTRDRLELRQLLKLGGPLMTTLNYAHTSVLEVYDRARELGANSGEHEALFGAVRGLWQGAIGRSDYGSAGRLADEMLALATRANEPALLLEAHRAVGNSAFWPGHFQKAQRSMHNAVQISQSQPAGPLPAGFSQDPDIANRGLYAWTLASLGCPRSAGEQLDRALERAYTLQHPFSMAYAVGSAMWTYFVLRDTALAADFAKQMIAVSHEYAFPYFAVAGQVVQHWVRAQDGESHAALTDLVATLQAWRDTSAGIGMAIFLYTQAEVEALCGKPRDALNTLADPLLVERLEVEQWYLADVERLRGACEVQLGQTSAALVSLRTARRIATEQNARVAALRIACLEAQHFGRDEHWTALRTVLDSLPETHDNGTIAHARRMVR
jgi:class 3 adenylate cyclase